MPATVVGAATATDADVVHTHAPDKQWSKSHPYEQRPSRLPVMPVAVVPPVFKHNGLDRRLHPSQVRRYVGQVAAPNLDIPVHSKQRIMKEVRNQPRQCATAVALEVEVVLLDVVGEAEMVVVLGVELGLLEVVVVGDWVLLVDDVPDVVVVFEVVVFVLLELEMG